MFGGMRLSELQELWWFIVSLIGSIFLFLTFVQGGQALIHVVTETEEERTLVIESLGRKWELTFTTLVLFGGALFAAFPKFYATSFGGAYWVWMVILLSFVLQAVSYEFRDKPGNLLGQHVYDFFLFLNGAGGTFLLGVILGTFFTGANFTLNAYNQVTWHHPLRGLEAAFVPFNLLMGLFLVFLSRILGAMYVVNSIDHHRIAAEARLVIFWSSFCWYVTLSLIYLHFLTMDGYHIARHTGLITMTRGQYFTNLKAVPLSLAAIVGGPTLILLGGVVNNIYEQRWGLWLAGPGTVLLGLGLFAAAGNEFSPFYPSRVDPQQSLTIYNASSSQYTLTVMSYAALAVPLVLAYIAYVWRLMESGNPSEVDLTDSAPPLERTLQPQPVPGAASPQAAMEQSEDAPAGDRGQRRLRLH